MHIFKSADLFSSLTPLILVFVVFAVLTILKNWPTSGCVKGWLGEKRTSLDIRQLDPAIYHVFEDVYLPRPDKKGTTQIDHVVISPFGIFVIETKNYRGWIFGDEKQAKWTQNLFGKKYTFQNPLHQNELHVRALAIYLDQSRGVFHSIIYFIGDCELKTRMPGNVLTSGLKPYLKNHRTEFFTTAEVNCYRHQMEQLTSAPNKREIARQHVRDLKKIHS